MNVDDYLNRHQLEGAATEEDFDRAAVDLLEAMVEEVTFTAQLLPAGNGDSRPWNRDEAVCVGLLVRCSKLLRAYADHYRGQEFEICNYLMRGIIESLVNTFFLVRFGTAEMLQRFRALSFRHDKQVLELIKANIAKRGGLVLPIEERISSAIERRLLQAGISLDEVPSGGREKWGGTDKEKLEALELEDLYQVFFVGPSAYIHGTWHELVIYHLHSAEDGSFEPTLDFSDVRPHYALSLCQITAEVAAEYVAHRLVGVEGAAEIAQRLAAMHEAALEMEQLHENYLGRTGGPELAF